MNKSILHVVVFVFAAALLAGCNDDDTTVTTTTFPDEDHPRLVSAISTSNTSILVTFSQPMSEDSTTDVSHYRITANQSGDSNNAGTQVIVTRASLVAPTDTSVRLTTLAQSDIEYRLTVSNILDAQNRPIASGIWPDDPATVVFVGIGPDTAQLTDSDNDGLSDAAEQRGWTVGIVPAGGDEPTLTHVTSDPFASDTDGDGIDDAAERNFGTNPRAGDTDGDELSDYIELTEIFSSPVHQDSDADSLQDGLEFTFFRTSPLLSDTDGDQLPDFEEVIAGNRDPLISDLPQPRIRVGNVDLQLDVRFAFIDQEGQQRTSSESVSARLVQSEDETYTTSDESSTKSTLEVSSTLETEVSFPKGGGVKSSLGITAGMERGSTSTFGTESSESSEEAYEESLSTSETVDISKSVTRTVEGASIKTDITIENVSDIPFTISNIELSAQTQDPRNRRRLIPIASLVPENPSFDSVNIGALGDPGRGPFVYSALADSVFPQQIERLLKSPRGMVVNLANFDITDEAGRNFVFASQDVLDRTAGINIDFGDGHLETYRVATASTHDFAGRPRGITMEYALDGIIGLSRYATINDGGNGRVDTTAEGDDEQIVDVGEEVEPGGLAIRAGENGVLETTPGGDDSMEQPGYATTLVMRDTNNDGTDDRPVEILTRVRDIETGASDSDPGDGLDEREMFWVAFSSKELDPRVNFNDLVLRAGDQFNLAYVRDRDQDGVWAREEYLHGSSDLRPDTDFDGLNDKAEIQEGWLVQIRGASQATPTYPNPVTADSDRDRLLDIEERDCRLDPRQRDTDLDGLSDWEELMGLRVQGTGSSNMVIRDRFTGEFIALVPRYAGEAIIDGGDGVDDSTLGGDDELVGPSLQGTVIITAGPDGMLQSSAGGDDFVAATHEPFALCNTALSINGFATDPLNDDTDGDFIKDAAELALGINPNNPADGPLMIDDDGDGVANRIEEEGFDALINGVVTRVNSSASNPDSDGDYLPDLLEHFLGSDPQARDTDGDGILDVDEYRNGLTCLTRTRTQAEPCTLFKSRLFDNYQDFLQRCDEADVCFIDPDEFADNPGSNLNEIDSDYDNVNDPDELTNRQIAVNGAIVTLPAPVSDPLLANTDTDGWDDGQERGFGTDPRNADTDDDGTIDSTEPVIGTNPVQADQKIKFEYTSIIVAGCKDGDGSNPEITGTWRITKSDEPSFIVHSEDDNNSWIGENLIKSPTFREFLLLPGDSVITNSSGTFEDDTPPWDAHDDISEFSETFTFPVKTQLKQFDQMHGSDTCLTVTLSVVVAGAVEPLFAVTDSVTVDENGSIDITVIDNDLLGIPPTTINFVSVATNGTTSIVDPQRTVRYVPDTNFNGIDQFVYTLGDSTGGTSTASIFVTVTSVDDGTPVAVDDPDAATTLQDTPVNTIDVLANDTLVDNAAISGFDDTSVNGGTLTFNGDGTFLYEPAPGFTGADSFQYTLRDDEGESDTATVTMVVNP
jgi:hypothetical protein